MSPRVVIENAVLKGTHYDLQRVATVYVDGHECRVLGPARAQGQALDWAEHFVVREPSKAEFAFGAEVPVDDNLVAVVVQAVVEELRREDVEADFWDWGNRPNARYYYAQLCLHGHVITAGGLDKIKEEERCQICGTRCIHRCEKCNAPIRGKRTHHGGADYQVPAFCYKCATPYPWMQDRLDTAHELLWHDDKLSLEDREHLWGLLQYVMTDPKSDLAPAKRKLIEIMLQPALAATRQFVIDLTAKTLAEMSKS